MEHENSILRYIGGRKWTWIAGLVLTAGGILIFRLTDSILILAAIILIFVGAYYLLRALLKDIPAIARGKKCVERLKTSGKLEQAARELAEYAGTPMGRDKTAFTPNYLFGYRNGVAVGYEEIIWAYKHRFTQRVIGIPVKTVDSLVIYTAAQKNICAVNMGRKDKNNELDQAVMQIQSKNKSVLLGYSKENRQAYKNLVKA